MTTGADRRQQFGRVKDDLIARYLENDQIEAYNLHEPDNAFFVKHQVVVSRDAADEITTMWSRFDPRKIAPTLKLSREVRPWDEPDDDGSDPAVAVVFNPRKKVNIVEFAAEAAAKRSGARIQLNHMVTGFQRHTGWPDGDPERAAPGSLPKMPTPRPPAGAGVNVAVIDTGYPALDRYGNTAGWFAPGVLDDVQGWDVVDEDRDGYLDVEAGHGLFVAGLIRRIAPSARLIHLKALNSDGIGTELGVAARIRDAVDNGADIINLSLGFYALNNVTQQGVKSAIEDALSSGAAVVAAAGNDTIDDPAFPAALPDVIGVGAMDPEGSGWADFSNRGVWVNVAAPGERVQSAYVGGREDPKQTADKKSDVFKDTALWSGTSFACANVTGYLAARLSEPDGDRTPAERARDLIADLPVLDGVTRRLEAVAAF